MASQSPPIETVYVRRAKSGATPVHLGGLLGSPGKAGAVYSIVNAEVSELFAVKLFLAPSIPPLLASRIDFAQKRGLYTLSMDEESPVPFPTVAGPTALVYRDLPCADAVGALVLRLDPTRFMSFSDFVDSARPWGSLTLLHVAARRLAEVVAHIHAQNFVVGDMSGTNVRIDDDGFCSVLDVDSFGVLDEHEVTIVASDASSMNFTAPEVRSSAPSLESDRFVLATMVLQILLRGAHPYDGVFKHADHDSVQANIFAGKSWLFEPKNFIMPPPYDKHPGLSVLPENLALLAERALLGLPCARPTAADWVRELAIDSPVGACDECASGTFSGCACWRCGVGPKRRLVAPYPPLPQFERLPALLTPLIPPKRRRWTARWIAVAAFLAAALVVLILVFV